MLRLRQSLVVVGSAIVSLLGGCNAVLGIDEARSRDGLEPVSGYREIPLKECNAPKPADCGACATGDDRCGPLMDSCLSDHACREAVNKYRGCLGTQCSDPTCFDALMASPASNLGVCIERECRSCAGTSPLLDMCDLYCGCMQQECGTVLQGENEMPWALSDPAACRQACLTLNDLPSTHCRWTHCEIKNLTGSPAHCIHAISNANCPTSLEISQSCTDRSMKGWACDSNLDCCSGNCGDNNICAD